jgi:hypothetical protein
MKRNNSYRDFFRTRQTDPLDRFVLNNRYPFSYELAIALPFAGISVRFRGYSLRLNLRLFPS